MALNKSELEYIKTTIEWMVKNTELIEHNRTQTETIYNATTNSIISLERAIGECSDENAALPLHGVSDLVCDCIKKEPCTFTEHGKIITRCINCGGRIAN